MRPTTPEAYVTHCWQSGFGVSETRKAARKFFGLSLSPQEIQRRFAELSAAQH